MKYHKSILFIFSLLSALTIRAQIKIIEGDISVLKSTKAINVVFKYDGQMVGKIKYNDIKEKKSEDEYIKEKITEKNKDEEWVKDWVSDRQKIYEPNFNKFFKRSSDIEIGQYPNAPYTLIYKTTFLDPGVGSGTIFSNRNTATIQAEIEVVETANPTHIVAKLTQQSSGVAEALFNQGQRIGDAYSSAGRLLGKFIKKGKE